MNHKKFIQLLNLYIDGEASAIEAREVEHEIEHDPARRRIYHEYCRIQAATRTVYHQFQSAAGSARHEVGAGRLRAVGVRTAAALPGRVSGPPFRRVVFWASGAAAACFAVAVAFWSLPHAGAPERKVQTAAPQGVSVPTVEAPTAVAATASPSGTYAAPLAAESRSESFLTQTTVTAGDPFALTAPPHMTTFGDPELVLSAVPSYEVSRFVPASAGPIDPARVAEQNRKLQAILRSGIARDAQNASAPVENRPGQGQGGAVPVNFRQQP